MSRKLLSAFLTVLLVATLSMTAFAEMVIVTKNGKKYHPEHSRYAQFKNVEKVSLEEAVERGYEPSRSYLKYLEYKEIESEEMKAKKAKKK